MGDDCLEQGASKLSCEAGYGEHDDVNANWYDGTGRLWDLGREIYARGVWTAYSELYGTYGTVQLITKLLFGHTISVLSSGCRLHALICSLGRSVLDDRRKEFRIVRKQLALLH